jgi:RNA polymerase sigma-70 factor (ECF subfamily)
MPASRRSSNGGFLAPGSEQGAAAVAERTLRTAHSTAPKLPLLVNGAAGVVITDGGQPVAVIGFTVSRGRIVEMDAIVDPQRLLGLDLSVHDD